MTDRVTTNWRDLPAGYPLDRLIAERKGWTNIKEKTDWYEDPESGPYEEMRLYGTSPHGSSEARIQRFSVNTDDALSLFDRDQPLQLIRLGGVTGEWTVQVLPKVFAPVVRGRSPVGKAERLPLAIARAWMESGE